VARNAAVVEAVMHTQPTQEGGVVVLGKIYTNSGANTLYSPSSYRNLWTRDGRLLERWVLKARENKICLLSS